MKAIFIKTYRALMKCLIVGIISINLAQANVKTTVDTSSYNSTELEMHKAIIFAALHYQWEITEHTPDSFKLRYKKFDLDVKIEGQSISITHDNEEMNAKWLPRLKKLIERRLDYDSRVRAAQSMLN